MIASRSTWQAAAASQLKGRRGAAAVEFAVVGPVALLFLISLAFAGLASFRYVQLANVSRHAARWAAVHGKRHASAAESAPITKQDVFEQAIQPRLLASTADQFKWDVVWSSDGRVVTVSLEYSQPGEAFFVGGTIHSTSTAFVVR